MLVEQFETTAQPQFIHEGYKILTPWALCWSHFTRERCRPQLLELPVWPHLPQQGMSPPHVLTTCKVVESSH